MCVLVSCLKLLKVEVSESRVFILSSQLVKAAKFNVYIYIIYWKGINNVAVLEPTDSCITLWNDAAGSISKQSLAHVKMSLLQFISHCATKYTRHCFPAQLAHVKKQV